MSLRQVHEELLDGTRGVSPEEIEFWYKRIQSSKESLSMLRLEIGALLFLVKSHNLWRGKARSFTQYLEEAHINSSSAREWMKVAQKFYFELNANGSQLRELAQSNMNLLSAATKVADADNIDEILGMLSTLSERDAREELSLIIEEKSENTKNRMSPRASKVVSDFYNLPDDLRIDVMRSIAGRERVDTDRANLKLVKKGEVPSTEKHELDSWMDKKAQC